MTGTTALRLIWDVRDGSNQVSANGVEVATADGRRMNINVTQEVVVSGGSYGSPPLLERSGIGNERQEYCLRVSALQFLNERLGYSRNMESTLWLISQVWAKTCTSSTMKSVWVERLADV